MDEKTRQKWEKLQALGKEKERIEKEIAALLEPEKVVATPAGFVLNNEVLEIVRLHGEQGVSKPDVLRLLNQKYPAYGIDRKRVASSLAYLKNTKREVELVGRGMYKYVDKQKSVADNPATDIPA